MINRLFKILICAFCLMCAYPLSVQGSDAALRIKQVEMQPSYIKAYIDVRDDKGSEIINIEKEQISAALDSESLPIVDLNTFDKSGEGIAYIFLVDISLSINKSDSSLISQSIGRWIENMSDKDIAAIITFGNEVTLAQKFTNDRFKLKSTLGSITSRDNNTKLYEGLITATELASSNEKGLPAHRVIIMLSDGQDDSKDGPAKQDLLDKLGNSKSPIYSIGFDKTIIAEDRKQYQKDLESFSDKTYGHYYSGMGKSLNEIYNDIFNDIRQSYILKLSTEKLKSTGKVPQLKIEYKNNDVTASDNFNIVVNDKDVALKSEKSEEVEPISVPQNNDKAENNSDGTDQNYPICIAIISSAILASILILIFLLFKKRRKIKNVPEIEHRDNTVIPLMLEFMGSKSQNDPYEIKLVDSIVIGRDSKFSDIAIDDEDIESEQIEISRLDTIVLIRNMNPDIEAYLNGVPIKDTLRLRDGDLIFLGNTALRVLLG